MLPKPVVEEHSGFLIVRDDLLKGGTKMRAIMPLIESSLASEFVYASPAQGYAQVALAYCARMAGRKATIFTAKRKEMHPLTSLAKQAGAKIVMIPNGYLVVVQARARDYAKEVGAYLVPFGVEDKRCMQHIAAAAQSIGIQPSEVWTVAGSGVLTRSLQIAWPSASFNAVLVGKKDSAVGKARRIIHLDAFDKPARILPPFPSAKNYDAKAWEHINRHASLGALFWNVGA